MRFAPTLYALVVSAGLLGTAIAADNDNNNNNNDDGGSSGTSTTENSQGSDDGSLTLSENVVQTASASVGAVNETAGEAESETSNNNFINFCEGQELTNGLQTTSGSCNGIPMGQIPSTQNMVSTVITFPQNGQTISANEDFTFSAQIQGLEAGTFTNAATTYYSAPQRLNSNGQIIGHTHFTCQQLDDSNQDTPLDPNTFAFFKGVDDAGNGNGLLSAAVDGGLPSGDFRVCTMTSSSNHQPVLMPVSSLPKIQYHIHAY
ncbi:putative fungal transcriptional regulatory protein [Phaeomoniella chlamydospora]|uniref:Putative fungal transcriptional regulatory protein n=1 Tax=Phaeomoniella chlamydospora TaxID=158046 RepID=A0A0G2GD57_PHACM|nr:putative fungal transcriptional regulatory protein [Phaeomoniella chlamydospora]